MNVHKDKFQKTNRINDCDTKGNIQNVSNKYTAKVREHALYWINRSGSIQPVCNFDQRGGSFGQDDNKGGSQDL